MAQAQIDEIHNLLNERYYDVSNPASYRSVDVLLKDVNRIQKELNRPAVRRSVVKEWLEGEESYSALKQTRIKFSKNRYKIPENNGEHLQCDLISVRQFSEENDGVTMLLGCIDLRSRYAWLEPLLSKDATDVLKGFKRIMSDLQSKGFTVKRVQVDLGKEFYNKLFKEYMKTMNITLFTSNKPVFIERFNRTFLNILYKVHTKTRSRRTVHLLNQLISNYNKSYHRGIKATPYNVFMGIEQPKDGYAFSKRSKTLFDQQIERDHSDIIPINSLVRVSWNPVEGSNLFTKGYHSKWSEEIFRVREYKHKQGRKVLYYLVDLKGENVDGSFYREELNRVSERFLKKPLDIDKVLRFRKLRNKPYREALVTYKVYPRNYYSWIRADSIEDVLQK
jgi:hypothetical protein